MNHPNFVQCYECWISRDYFYFRMEYLPCGDLQSLIARRNGRIFTEQFCLFVLSQLANGLEYLHNKQLIHRDIKPSNILIKEDGTIKIGDFGTARKMIEDDKGMTFTGTQYYMASEVLYSQYDQSIDIYSLGCVMYELCTLYIAFELYLKSPKKCNKKDYQPLRFYQYEKEFVDLIFQMISFEPKDRPTAQEIVKKMKDSKNEKKIKQFEKDVKDGKEIIA